MKSKLIKVMLLSFIIASCDWYSSIDSIKLDPKAFNIIVTKKDVQLVDVRTPKEFAQGHIEAAININYFSDKFEDSLRLLAKDKPVYIYCRSGKRSAKSVSRFKEAGFDSIYELEGGLLNWRNKGLKTIISD